MKGCDDCNEEFKHLHIPIKINPKFEKEHKKMANKTRLKSIIQSRGLYKKKIITFKQHMGNIKKINRKYIK